MPVHQERVWGGQRFAIGDNPVGEVWIVWEGNEVADGPDAGRTLGDVTAELGEPLVGRRARRFGTRFPLLIKLLDTREWLSVQVHPNDDQARELEGEAYVGKTEAWHVLGADPDARVIAGLRPGVDRRALAEALTAGSILDLVEFRPAEPGSTLYIPAGTIHALGPGLLVYEVQQSSDITYRVFDWDRPQSAGRVLHTTQTLAVADPAAVAVVRPSDPAEAPGLQELAASPYFVLERVICASGEVLLDTDGESFHAVTLVVGEAELTAADGGCALSGFDTVLVPAATGEYRLTSPGPFTALVSRLP